MDAGGAAKEAGGDVETMETLEKVAVVEDRRVESIRRTRRGGRYAGGRLRF